MTKVFNVCLEIQRMTWIEKNSTSNLHSCKTYTNSKYPSTYSLDFFNLSFHLNINLVTTLALGLRPKQRLTRLWAKREAQESHFMLSGVQKSVREWTLTFPNELSFWELESWWTLESSEGDYRGQNSLDWKVPYIIGNLLQRRSKVGSHDPFGQLKHKLWPKEGSGVKFTIWFPTTKS
jgi:hypothetical protein